MSTQFNDLQLDALRELATIGSRRAGSDVPPERGSSCVLVQAVAA